MNPPSAIHGAMNRDRKPFTYTPGGLDLSEIKSERMAKRLMRNAMNQGVPEVPTHPVQSPPMPSTPILVPNYNCLPVQVFPTFNLPANPKSLLRTRSNPDTPKDPPVQRVPPPYHFTNNNKESNIESYEPVSKPTFSFITTNNNRPTSAYEYVNNPYETVQTNNGCIGFKNPYELPEISYDAEYLTSSPIVSHVPSSEPFIKFQNNETDEIKNQNGEHADLFPKILTPDISVDALTESEKTTDAEETSDDKKQVKFVSKTVKNEGKIEEQNGDHNGDVEAEMTVMLPTKKTGAKTETRVEVVKKILPDGTVQEVKTTTTKTTIDGKTEIKTETETRTLPKEEADEEIEEFEEELEEQENANVAVQEVEEKSQIVEEPEVISKKIIKENTPETKEDNIIKGEEKSETTTTTTRKVVILQADSENSKEDVEEMVEEEEVEEEEVEDSEPVTVVIKNTESITPKHNTKEEDEEEEEIEDEEVEEEEKEVIEEKVAKEEEIESAKENLDAEPENDNQNEESRLEEEEEVVVSSKKNTEVEQTLKSDDDDDGDDEVYEEAEQNEVEKEVEVITETVTAEEKKEAEEEDDDKSEVIVQVDVLKPSSVKYDEEEVNEECKDIETETAEAVETKENNFSESSVRPSDTKQETVVEIKIEEKEEAEPEKKTQIPMREPSVPLEKVEDVEIKPIGPAEVITKTHTEKTEIFTRTSPVPGAFSTQTEYNRIEKIETVNRTTKTLDGTCEDPVQTEIPVIKTYFPPNRDRSLSSPMPSRPFQQAYNPEPTTERRHSLLLERLSVERQMPSEIYHNQNNEQQRQWSQEPQSEVLTISNVKPSSITNQQWYQQIRENSVYNDVTPTPVSSTPIWSQSQPKHQPSPQPQPQPQLQPTYRPQPTYPTNQTYTPQPTQKPITPQATQQTYASQPQQKIYTPQPIQRPYTPQPTTPILQSQYQPTYTETTQERSSNTYTSYTPKPTWASSIDTTPSFNLQQPSQYNYVNTETTDNYQKTSQQYSSSYVPPPWEQDSSYLANNSSQSYYQPLPTTTLTPTAPAQSWKPPVPKSKFAKPPPTAYIPPAPNQSFVKPVNAAEQSKQSGRKTYYSEYERRYISVPESTYIPTETKFQAQPDPSPQYYYDNNEQPEPVEHQWRKELREFTEKSQTQTEQTSIKPPWETESKFTKTAESTYASTPTWSQTLRPRSWRERSFEREFTGSQEWPKTNTLGRSRPLSSYAKNEPILERTRGVSVDRYNPNNYQSPSSLEHPPVQSHTLIPAPHGTYHNPNVPNYHSRASTETREQATYKQPRAWRESRPTPIQSRSFKYLQWITGTED